MSCALYEMFIYILIIPSIRVPQKCAPYMGDLAACTWSARGNPGYGDKWAGRCTPHSWAQRAVESNGGFLNGRAHQLGAFSVAGARRLQAFLHYSSSHNRAKHDCGLLTLLLCESRQIYVWK